MIQILLFYFFVAHVVFKFDYHVHVELELDLGSRSRSQVSLVNSHNMQLSIMVIVY